MPYELVIGLEVHVQLKTISKLFCGCSTVFGGEPNSQTCPVCLGLPGALPVANQKTIDWGILAGLAFNCKIAERMKFDRKQYYYPDLPKNYQISQFDLPLAREGFLELGGEGSTKRVGITRIHLEEDAGKLLHDISETASHVDFNRAGVPLLEIVSEPDLRSAEEAYQYLVELKAIVQYLGISTCNMEEGSLRCDTNISLRPKGAQALGTKVEIKNLNSFRAVRLAVEFEVERQTAMLDQEERIVQETRLWDAQKNCTTSMRSKEGASDYRFFPEPDLVPFMMERARIESIRKELPELPAERRARYQKEYQLSVYDSRVLTQDRNVAELLDQAVREGGDAKRIANWLMGDLMAYVKAKHGDVASLEIQPAWLVHLVQLVERGTVSGKMAKELFVQMLESRKDPEQLVAEQGLKQITDGGELEDVAREVISQNEKSVADYRGGKVNAVMFLVGQAMKRTKGKANPQQMQDILKRQMEA